MWFLSEILAKSLAGLKTIEWYKNLDKSVLHCIEPWKCQVCLMIIKGVQHECYNSISRPGEVWLFAVYDMILFSFFYMHTTISWLAVTRRFLSDDIVNCLSHWVHQHNIAYFIELTRMNSVVRLGTVYIFEVSRIAWYDGYSCVQSDCFCFILILPSGLRQLPHQNCMNNKKKEL